MIIVLTALQIFIGIKTLNEQGIKNIKLWKGSVIISGFVINNKAYWKVEIWVKLYASESESFKQDEMLLLKWNFPDTCI